MELKKSFVDYFSLRVNPQKELIILTINPQLLETILRQPRYFVRSRLVYSVISQRAGGLSIGINMIPDQACDFNCLYCEVKRNGYYKRSSVNVQIVRKELTILITLLKLGKFRKLPPFTRVPDELLQLKAVTLSGDGEPTTCPNFSQVVKEVIAVRKAQFVDFKTILITNGTGLHLKPVQEGLNLFTEKDEIWIKLDAGTQKYMSFVNQTKVPIDVVIANIKALGRQRSIIIQSLFCSIHGQGPSDEEIEAYVQRLADLKNEGAQISLVQVYSITRPPAQPGCTHLPLKQLSNIARRIREKTQLKTEVY